MTLPINVRWLVLGGILLLLLGLGLGYLAFYSPKIEAKPATVLAPTNPVSKDIPPVKVTGETTTDSSGNTSRVDTVYIYVPCPEMSSPLAQPQLKTDAVFTDLPTGLPGFNFTPTFHMPAFTIHQPAPLLQFGAKLGMDPIQGFWAGGAIARLSLGDFHIVAEAGLMRDLFFFIISLEVYFYSILRAH